MKPAVWTMFAAAASAMAPLHAQVFKPARPIEDGIQKSADFAKFLDALAERMRPILADAGLKAVR